MAEISDILTKLLERTNQDRISWQTTADDQTFLAVLGNSSVSIDEDYDRYGGIVYVLKILNKEGREIERINSNTSSDEHGNTWRSELSELYIKARRVALGVDSQLDSLLQELEADI